MGEDLVSIIIMVMGKKMFNQAAEEVEQVIETVDETLGTVLNKTNRLIEPARQSVFRRFPAVFLLLVTFGVSATFYGFELLMSQWAYFYERPLLILLTGVSILIGTGTLYKKLG